MAPRLLRWPLVTMLSLSLMLGSFGSLSGVFASSHREAPLTSQDPAIDNTDTYAFLDPADANYTVLVANSYPFGTAGGGPNFFRFADDALYTIAISNDGGANADITYVFKFTTAIKNKSTFLYNTGKFPGGENVTQTYDVYKYVGGDFDGRLTGPKITKLTPTPLPVAPAVVGPKSQSNSAGASNYADLANAAIKTIGSGNDTINVFTGPRADPFFVDLNVFDLLALGSGTNSLKDYNVQSIVMRVKSSTLTNGTEPVIGVCAMNYRLAVRVIKGENARVDRGRYQQVSRLCNPLVNEVVMDLGLKDIFNGAKPKDDGRGTAPNQPIVNKVTSNELAGLMKSPDLLNLSFVPTTNRTDLVAVFLTGIAGVNKPANVVASEMLRLNTTPTVATGFPNGRKLTDDVVDVAIQAVAGLLSNDPAAVAANATIKTLGDGVNAPDKALSPTFPYLATPYLKTVGLQSR